MRDGAKPPWGDQPVAPAFAERLIADGAVDLQQLRTAGRADPAMRAQCKAALWRVMNRTGPGNAGEAAQHGLELVQPFHDKRVVELAQAVPEHLYVKGGRNRYLACAALKDLYPREFQTRWRTNDDEIPDFQRMAKAIEPQLLADIARMEEDNDITRYIDFAKIRSLLAARGPGDHNSGWEQETQLALHGYAIARFLKWSRQNNF